LALQVELQQMDRDQVREYSDDQGEPAVQRSISQQRADAVKRALVESGIPAEKIEAVGLGFVEPKHGRAAVSQLEKWKQELAACDSEEVSEARHESASVAGASDAPAQRCEGLARANECKQVKELAACDSKEVTDLTRELEDERVQFRVVELVATLGGAP
jgi:hypothetical protein